MSAVSTAHNIANSLDLPLIQARRGYATDVTCIKAQQLAAIKRFQSLGASPPFGGSISSGRIEAQLNSDGGVLTVPVEINGSITLDFVIDSGASDVNIPADVVSTLIRTRTIRPSDFIGQQTYVLADGTEAPSAISCRPFAHELCPTGSRQTKNFYCLPYSICLSAACVEQHSV